MAEMKIERMDADTFLEWCTHQEERYELVDGVPRMMAGAPKGHDRAVRFGLLALVGHLNGGPCEAFTQTVGVRIPNGGIRRADIVVDCGSTGSVLLHIDRPVLVVLVLSQSTKPFDSVRKVAEYQSVPSIRHILLIDPETVAGVLHTRAVGETWTTAMLSNPEAEIALPALSVTLLLSDFYE